MPTGRFSPLVFPGARFGILTVIERIPKKDGQRSKIRCLCDCGQEVTPNAENVTTGHTTSCGCVKKAMGAKNSKARVRPDKGYGLIVPGAVFGRLTVLERLPDRARIGGKKRAAAACRCECGVQFIALVDGLVSGNTESCGCGISDAVIKRNKESAKFGSFSSDHPVTWASWNSMMARCLRIASTSYTQYGARGVKVCAFLQEKPQNLVLTIGHRESVLLSIDRFPIHDGHYACGQCEECRTNGWSLNIRWATRKQQALNRGGANAYLTAFGLTMTRSRWQETTGLCEECVRKRIKRGWSVEKALSTPDKQGNCYRPPV